MRILKRSFRDVKDSIRACAKGPLGVYCCFLMAFTLEVEAAMILCRPGPAETLPVEHSKTCSTSSLVNINVGQIY